MSGDSGIFQRHANGARGFFAALFQTHAVEGFASGAVAGNFGENLTTSGIEVTQARIGERWRIGTDGLVLEVSAPRTS